MSAVGKEAGRAGERTSTAVIAKNKAIVVLAVGSNSYETASLDQGPDVANELETHLDEDTAIVRVDLGVADSSDDTDDSSEDEASIVSQTSLYDKEGPITSIQALVDKFFGESGAFRPRYSYAQTKQSATSKRSSEPLDDTHVAMLTHDSILQFLAPHEIMALWRTNKTTWDSMVPRQRFFVMMRSVFSFLRISEEAAQHVDKMIIGGWHAYCPLMVLLCEHLASVYGNFEIDAAHCVFMAHQACFYPKSRGFWRCGSDLAEHEVRLARVLDFRDRHMINYSQPASKLQPPTLDLLKIDSHIGWGDGPTYFERENIGIRKRLQQTAVRNEWHNKQHSWMQEHASEAPNAHYRLRLERGLSPCIWVDQSGVHLSPDTDLELQLWALGIGSKRQQFLGTVSATQPDKHQRSFEHCLEYDPSSPSCLRGGFMELILRRSHSAIFDVNHDYDDRCWPTLGILIWCMRRGLAPFLDTRIDWQALIEEVCRRESHLFRRFYREGFVPWDPFGPHAPRPDPVDQKFIEREKGFYADALTSPRFAQADFVKYV